MANVKVVSTNDESGADVYAIIQRENVGLESTWYVMDKDDGVFKSPVGLTIDNYGVTLNESSISKGFYRHAESRQVWTDGWYTVTVYTRQGAVRDPAVDTSRSDRMYISSDLEQNFSTVNDVMFTLPAMNARVYTATALQDREVELVSTDTPTITFTLGDDYTGWNAYFGAKLKESDDEYVIPEKLCIWSNVENGIGYVLLSSAETNRTGNFYGEIIVVSGTQKLTVVKFKLNFRKGILRQ